jgi:plastocyanin
VNIVQNGGEMNKNRKILDLVQVVLVIGLVFSVFLSSNPKEHVVEMTENKFVPSKITIKRGDSIKFVNKSKNFHNVVVEKLKIRTKLIKKGEFLVIKPAQVGDFSYYCQPHRSMGMTGEITIE